MRHSAVLWGLIAALVLAGGCERREEVEEPKPYDPTIDSPPSTIGVEPNPLLLANQVEIAKRSPKPTAAPAAGPAEAAGEAVEGVKSTLLRLLDAVEAKQTDAVADFFVPEDAASMRSILAAMPALQQKLATVNRLVRDKLGIELGPEPTAEMMGSGVSGLGLPAWLDRATLMADPSPLQFAAQGDKVTVSRNGQEPMTLANLSGTWKIEPNPQERLAISMGTELIQATNTMADATVAGINNGTITKDNFQAKTQAMAEQYLSPIMNKYTAAAQAAMAGGTAAMAGGTATVAGGTVAMPSGPTAAGVPTPAGGTTAAEGPAAAASPAPGAEVALDAELPEFPQERDDPGHLETVTSMWLSNTCLDALGHFVGINWDKPGDFGTGSLYAISQLRFGVMSESQRTGVTEQAAIQAKALKEMTARLSAMAAYQATAGNTETAQKYIRAIAGCATFLQQPRRLTALRELGAEIAKMPDPLSAGHPIAPVLELTRPGDGPVDPGCLETVAIILASKEKDQALKEFMRIDWRKPAVLAPDSDFLLTDEQVLAMPANEREPVVDDVSGLDRAMRDLANYAVSQAKAEPAKAKRYMDALAGLSSFLQQEQYMLVLRVRGESIARMTNPATNKPIGKGPAPPPDVLPPKPAAPSPTPPAHAAAPASPEENINAGRGSEAAEAIRNQLLAPTRRLTGGGE
jgi:hypothetical protein